MDTSKIKFIIIGILATFVALYLGISAASAQFETIAWVLGSAVFIASLSLGRKIWLLIPFTFALGIGLRLPGQPDSGLLGQFLVLGFSIPLFLMRKLPLRLAWTELEFWILLLTLFVLQVYVRNPVGLNILRGASVGGKPYVIYVICLATGLLLGSLKVPASELKWILRLSILGGLLNLAVSLVGVLVPAVGYFTGAVYLRADQASNEIIDTGAATRISFLSAFSGNLALWVSSYISPLRACVRPLWGALILLAIVAAMMSGFRNSVVAIGITFVLGIAYRSGFAGLVISIFGLTMGVALLAVINIHAPLPPNIQRSLTFLPGTWEQRYRKDASGSNEWRIEVWREVLMTDRWIDNKWLGDGLGYKASEFAAQQSAQQNTRTGVSGFDAHRENILKSGDYHSGPVQTIRTIGYVGLLCLLLAQIRLAVHAHRQIQRCRNSEWFPLALFVGIPLIAYPIFFTFIFGTFKDAASVFLIGSGMIRMLQNNLPLPAYVLARRVPYVLRTRPMLAPSALQNR
jgi:hypothetical protein